MKAIWLHNYFEIPQVLPLFTDRVYINNTDNKAPKDLIKKLQKDGIEVYQWILDSLRRGRDVEPIIKGVDGFILDGIRWEKHWGWDIPVHSTLGSLINTLPDKPIEVSVKVEGYLGNEWVFNKYAEKVWGLDYTMLTKEYGIDAICPMMYSKEYPFINWRYNSIIKWLSKYNKVNPIFYAKNNASSFKEADKYIDYSIFGWNMV